jgi:hypothetical protein
MRSFRYHLDAGGQTKASEHVCKGIEQLGIHQTDARTQTAFSQEGNEIPF